MSSLWAITTIMLRMAAIVSIERKSAKVEHAFQLIKEGFVDFNESFDEVHTSIENIENALEKRMLLN